MNTTPYEKQNFEPISELKAEQLNKMDDQIYKNAKKINMITPLYVESKVPKEETGPCILIKLINK